MIFQYLAVLLTSILCVMAAVATTCYIAVGVTPGLTRMGEVAGFIAAALFLLAFAGCLPAGPPEDEDA